MPTCRSKEMTFPRKVDTGLCGFPVWLLRGGVSDGGVDPPAIVIAFDVREQITPRGLAIRVVAPDTTRREAMAVCGVCGNEYEKTFDVSRGGETHTFDSFECAIHALAPTCGHCGCRIIGHGVETESGIFC